MDLVESMKFLACDIVNSFLRRKDELQHIRAEVCRIRKETKELLLRYAVERAEMTAKQRAELREYVERLQCEVRELLERYRCERIRFAKELYEAQQVWIELERTMERLRREDP